ncbi:MAG: PKD domain-containing protein [Bryobacterales bacterium]|nr:PKD domain-containing protein [Bryobacterales bacterium]
MLSERPIVNSSRGYTPHIFTSVVDPTPVPVMYECPVEFRWNFGDGTGVISTGERPSITHEYPDSGDFTLRVEAMHGSRLFAQGEKVIKVRNRPPRFPLVAAIQIDPATSLFELAAHATDVPGDPITYEWDFGDGQTLVTDQWRVQHAYPRPGRYTAKVIFRDDENATTEGKREIIVAGAGTTDDNTVTPLEQPQTGAARTSINLAVTGAASFNFVGEIRPVAGIFLGPRKPQGCRFMFSAWDNARLAYMAFILDLRGIRSKGATYKIEKPKVWFNLEADGGEFQHTQRALTGDYVIGFGGLGALAGAIPGVEDLTEEHRRVIANQAGVEPGARVATEVAVAPPTSPFGIEAHEGFTTESGALNLVFIPHDRAVGRLEIQLRNSSEKSPYQSVTIHGDFVLDLQAARRDGVVLYDHCGPADLTIESVTPADGETFLIGRTPNVFANFSGQYAPESLNDSTFQLTYPASGSGDLVPVDVRVFRRERSAWIRPEENLLGGVRYTARIKIGVGGGLDRAGNPIPDEDGTGWYTWQFSMLPNFAPTSNSAPGTEHIGCHVFQTVRDAPLIVGKPAAARIYVDWKRHPEVHPDAQLREFTARVALLNGSQEIVTDFKRFVRPDLWASESIDTAKAQHSANLYFTPQEDLPSSLSVKISMPSDIGRSVPPTVWSRCSTPKWKLAPEIKVQWYLITVNEWTDVDVEKNVRPWAHTIMAQAATLAEQLFPVKSVEMQYGGVMPYPLSIPDRYHGLHKNCTRQCADVVMTEWQRSPLFSTLAGIKYDANATTIVGIMPVRAADPSAGVEAIQGGVATQWIGEGEQGRIVFAFEENPAYRDRFVFGIVHELAHTLWLEHLPHLTNAQTEAQAEATRIRDAAWANRNTPALFYKGIEGFLISPNGGSGKNKSSTEGNEESSWLAPLMYPATMYLKDFFIARHHYLQLLQTWEKNGGISKP